MATRQQTIRVPVNFGSPADVADAVLTTIGTPTIYIPENSVGNPVTFTSVMLFVAIQDMSTATGGTLSEFRAACTLNGATATTFTELDDLVHTGENWSGIIGPIDFTAHFTSNYGTVTSKTCQVDVYADINTGTTTTTRGVYAYFEITYDFSDTAATRIQTISYGFESDTSTLTTTANTAYDTLLQLTNSGGLLNIYASPTIRHYWIEIRGNCNNNNTATDHNLLYSFDGTGSNPLPTREAALATDTWQMYQVDCMALSTTATHTFDLWGSLATRWCNVVVNVWVSFEYTVSGTTKMLCYLELAVEFDSPIAGTAATDRHRISRVIMLPEASIAQKNIALELSYNAAASATPQILLGSQASFRSYAMNANVVGGCFMFQHRGDSSSASGSAITLARGENTLNIDLYRSAGGMNNVTGLLKILYECDVPSAGVDAATHTVKSFQRAIDFTATADVSVSDNFPIPETQYWLTSAFLEYHAWLTATGFLVVMAEVASGEGAGDGWRALFSNNTVSDAEVSYTVWRVRARDEFKRHPNDPDTSRMNIETARRIRTVGNTAMRMGYYWVCAYHSQTFDITGTVSGSAGGTVTLTVRRTDTGEAVRTTTRSGNGSYTISVYDPVTSYYVDGYETSTRYGCSKRAAAGTGFDIALTAPIVGGRIQIT